MYREIEDTTSDLGIEVYSDTYKKLLEESGTALFSQICEINKIKPKKEIKIEVKANTLKSLTFNWLSSLITHADINELFLSQFTIDSITFISSENKSKMTKTNNELKSEPKKHYTEDKDMLLIKELKKETTESNNSKKTETKNNKSEKVFIIKATIKGEEISKEKAKSQIKAITYYDFKLEANPNKSNKWYLRFVCDI